MHQVFCSIGAFVLIRFFGVLELAHTAKVTRAVWCKKMLTVGLATSAALATGNSSYLFLTVSFIEILKGFTPVVTMAVQTSLASRYRAARWWPPAC